jgi:hypothetical protein
MNRKWIVFSGVAYVASFGLWGGQLRAEDAADRKPLAGTQAVDLLSPMDMAFDRYVDLAVVAHAWDSLNSELMADVALQVLEGERVLRRSHHVISAEQLMRTAIKVAADNRDKASLDRLAKVAVDTGRDQLADEIRQSEKLMSASRGDKETSVVSVEQTSPEQFGWQQAVLAEIRRARLTGDGDKLAAIEKDLASATALTLAQRKDLANSVKTAKQSISKPDATDIAVRETLDKLSSASRQWFVLPGGYPPSGVPYPGYYTYPQHTTTWYRNPYDPAANIAIPGTNRTFTQYVPGMGWVHGNQYIGLDGRPHGSTTMHDPWGGSRTTAYLKK